LTFAIKPAISADTGTDTTFISLGTNVALAPVPRD
jgi:hypothetical protein